jgi:hypothetical protein
MRTTILVAACMMAVTACYAGMPHSKEVPDAVRQSFMKQYPQQSVRRWVMRGDTCIAEFRMDSRKHDAYYLSGGEDLYSVTVLPWTKDLPEAVRMAWQHSRYASWQIRTIEEIKTGNAIAYTMTVFYDDGPDGSAPGDCEVDQRLSFGPDGTLIAEEREE